MALDFVSALNAEIEALELAIKNDPKHLKLAEAKRLLALYSGAALPEQVGEPAKVIRTSRSAPRSPERQAILDFAAELLANAQYPVPTSDIYKFVHARIAVPGANPKNNLSAMLSNSPRFQSHGRAGWTLATETPEAPDDLISRSASEASDLSASPAEPTPSVRPVDPASGGGT